MPNRRVAEAGFSELDPLRGDIDLQEFIENVGLTISRGFTRCFIDFPFDPFIDRRQGRRFELCPESNQVCGVLKFSNSSRRKIRSGENNQFVRSRIVREPASDS
jgi:hypothetical protein